MAFQPTTKNLICFADQISNVLIFVLIFCAFGLAVVFEQIHAVIYVVKLQHYYCCNIMHSTGLSFFL